MKALTTLGCLLVAGIGLFGLIHFGSAPLPHGLSGGQLLDLTIQRLTEDALWAMAFGAGVLGFCYQITS